MIYPRHLNSSQLIFVVVVVDNVRYLEYHISSITPYSIHIAAFVACAPNFHVNLDEGRTT